MQGVANPGDLVLLAGEFMGLSDAAAQSTQGSSQGVNLPATIVELRQSIGRRKRVMQFFGDAGKFRGQVLDMTSGVQSGCPSVANVVDQCAGLSRN